MKSFLCDCINPVWDTNYLSEIIDEAKEITKQTFLKGCCIDSELKQEMKEYPYDYTYYKYKDIYFYTWSCIEHFYK